MEQAWSHRSSYEQGISLCGSAPQSRPPAESQGANVFQSFGWGERMNKREWVKKYKYELIAKGIPQEQISVETLEVLYEMMKTFFSAQAKANAADGSDVQAVVAAYCEAWKARYQTSVQATPIMIRKAKELTSKLGRESAVRAIRHYLTREDQFYTRTRHPLEVAAKDAEHLHLEALRAESGKIAAGVTADQAKLRERIATNRSTIQQYLGKKEDQDEIP